MESIRSTVLAPQPIRQQFERSIARFVKRLR
jgi:hypothetical protein